MPEYIVKLNGQVVTQPLTYDEATETACQMNAENVTEWGEESIADCAENIYEVCPIEPKDARSMPRSANPETLEVYGHWRR
jgi:hypothetical protein